MTLLVDRGRESTPPGSARAPLRRAVVPLSWLVAAAIGVLVALLAVWVLRGPVLQDTARGPDDRASASAPSAAPTLPLGRRESTPTAQPPLPQASAVTAPAAPRPASVAVKPPVVPHSGEPSVSAPVAPPAAADASAKAHQSIY